MNEQNLIIATAIFLGGFILAVVALRTEKKPPAGLNIVIAIAGLVFQSLFLRDRGDLHGRCPITNGAEVLVFVSWSIVIMYLALGKAFRLSLLGVFTMPIVFLLHVIAIVYLSVADPGARPPAVLDPWLEMHAAMSLLAYGAFGLCGVAGAMYWVQDRQLKAHNTGRLFYSMPPIKYLIDAMIRLLSIGMLLLTLGIIAAFFMNELPGTLHFATSGAVWVLYAVLLAIYFTKRPSPKRFSLLVIGAFCFALLTLAAL
jgi:ABC-type uncharacterized transport system permease subunit